MVDSKHLLIVDDDPQLRQYVAQYLRDNHYTVHIGENAQAMDRVLAAEPIDLIVLDLRMPGEDGLSICRRLASKGGPAVIMVSAAGEEVDRVLGLELGADDYLPKPVGPRELLARVRAVLRRRENVVQGGAPSSTLYHFKGFTYDAARRKLRSPSDATILLTHGEASLLSLMLARPCMPLSREDLLIADAGGNLGRSLDIAIARLRRKLESHGGSDVVRTQRGEGYMIDCAVSQS